uniref:Retrotrans_gag domain-containing protein n=1 Tax=Angiostrongylus cantonensis TaxID=6313 RepID=A0A0K0DMP7_ANGCA
MVLILTPANADWWDSFTNTISDGFMTIGKWVKETASPTVREKFNNVKEVLQDPRTHQRIREFVSEKAEQASDFANREIVPEVKKIYDAATAGDDKSSPDRFVEPLHD